MNFRYSDALLENFVRESLQSRPLQKRKPRNGNLVLEVKRSDGLIRKIRLKESYITGVLGIKKKRLMESLHDPDFQREVLKEHLLFEGWWDSAKKFVGDAIDSVKEKVSDGSDALKEYGDNAKGVVAAIWAAAQDADSLQDFSSGAASLMSKSVAAINKAIRKIEIRLEELDLKDIAGVLAKTRETIHDMYKKITSVGGWKGLLTSLAGYLGFSWIREKVGPVLGVFYDALKGDIKEFSKMIANGAASVAQDYKEVLKIGPGDPTEAIKELVKEKLVNLIPDVLKEKISKLGGNAVASLAGPVGWLKAAYESFNTSKWVLEKLISAVRRGNFKVGNA